MWNSMFYSAHNGQINTIASNSLSEALKKKKKVPHNNSFRSGTHKERTLPLLSLGEIWQNTWTEEQAKFFATSQCKEMIKTEKWLWVEGSSALLTIPFTLYVEHRGSLQWCDS